MWPFDIFAKRREREALQRREEEARRAQITKEIIEADSRYQRQRAASLSGASNCLASADGDQGMRAGFLNMALRTPGLTGHDDVLSAAAAYQAYIQGEKTGAALQRVANTSSQIARRLINERQAARVGQQESLRREQAGQ